MRYTPPNCMVRYSLSLIQLLVFVCNHFITTEKENTRTCSTCIIHRCCIGIAIDDMSIPIVRVHRVLVLLHILNWEFVFFLFSSGMSAVWDC